MQSVLALIPARAGSKGIPGKNFRPLGGRPVYTYAADCAHAIGCVPVLSTDQYPASMDGGLLHHGDTTVRLLRRPAHLCTDSAPMIDVVRHALDSIPGPSDQIVLLLQPTQPFRTPAHLTAAIELLEQTGADSVVSVVALPLTHSPDLVCYMDGGRLRPWTMGGPTRRQDATPVYLRDGTCYATRRSTITRTGTLYGCDCRPLIIPAAESCELDTEQDWIALERRWKELHA